LREFGKSGRPFFLMAGDQDRHTSLAESQRLFDAAPEPKRCGSFTGAAHENFHRFVPAEYERRVLDFFEKTLRQDQALVELALRQQLEVYARRQRRPRLSPLDRCAYPLFGRIDFARVSARPDPLRP